ncbi:MAG TPA: PEP-CTERM/exosortase system-associated acyltransferase [Micropepsaceae bacterium]|nr:PEP-CTERM/exosortase system-associated acyltransferase [Micropepsaceae bacterium]
MDANHAAASHERIPEETLLDRFNRYFEAVPALTESDIQKSQRIRFQVYCVENPFENPADHPDGLERDVFDAHSVHSILIHRASGETMGTTRLIMPVPGALQGSFAIQQVCDHPTLNRLPLHRMAEVSRFSISKQFRRRKVDTLYEGFDTTGGQRSVAPLMSLGLIQSLVRMSAEYEITHWCATMEPTLLRLLQPMGIYFEPLGPLVQYHGLRQPCYCEVAAMLQRVKDQQRAMWEILTDGGVLLPKQLDHLPH